LVPDVSLTRSHYTLSAANKMGLTILEDDDLHFTVDRCKFVANVSVSPAIDEFLLGSDWLIKNQAKWDCAKGTISLGDRLIRAYWHTLNEV